MGRWTGVCPEWSRKSCRCSASPWLSVSQDLGRLSSLRVHGAGTCGGGVRARHAPATPSRGTRLLLGDAW